VNGYDSLTFGSGELSGGNALVNNDNNLGYRRFLQEMLWEERVDYDFVGGFGAGALSPFDPDAPVYTGQTTITNSLGQTRDLDLDHFGWPGAWAADDRRGKRSLAQALFNRQPSYFPVPVSPTDPRLITHDVLQFSNDSNTTQDVIVYGGLIQQDDAGAAADFVGPNPGFAFDAASVAASSNPNASEKWIAQVPDVILLHIGTNNRRASQVGTLLEALERDWRDGLIASNAKIIVSDILPSGAGSANSDFNGSFVQGSFSFNSQIENQIAALPDDFESLITRTSMFEIEITQDMLDTLGLADDSLLNPDPTDNFVDWAIGNYDESTNVGSIAGANTNLFGNSDFIHPNSLGYQVMAYQWLQAMKQVGVVPEPRSALLVLTSLGVLFLLNSRRSQQFHPTR